MIALIAAWEAGANWRRRLADRAEVSRRRWFWKVVASIGGSLATTLIASLATGAFAAYHFNRVSLLGIVANMVGVPLTGGFFGKFYIFKSALDSNLVWLTVLGLLNSAIAAYYYLRIIKLMYFAESEHQEAFAPLAPGPSRRLGRSHRAVLGADGAAGRSVQGGGGAPRGDDRARAP